MENLALWLISFRRNCLSVGVWPSEIYLIISLLQSPSSIITIMLALLVVIEDCFIASTGMIRLIVGSDVEAKASRASAVVFSPLGMRVNSNFSN